MSDYSEYHVTVRDEDGHLSTMIVHAHSDNEARVAVARATGGWVRRCERVDGAR